jgi:hypothetical protein
MANQQNQFSNDELEQMKRFGEALGGKPTPFSEEVHRWAEIHEVNYVKMRAARRRRQRSKRGPLQIEQSQAKQALGQFVQEIDGLSLSKAKRGRDPRGVVNQAVLAVSNAQGLRKATHYGKGKRLYSVIERQQWN